MKLRLLIATAASLSLVLVHCKKEEKPTEITPAKRVYFVEPANGAVLASPVTVKMGVEGMSVKPAGPLEEGTGHFHILVGEGPSAVGATIPADETHIHFGKGQTETTLKLKPGKVKLTLQFADGAHKSMGAEMASTIEITVK